MMRYPMILSVIIVGAWGCTETTAPDPFNTGIRVEALTASRAVGVRESDVANLPAVRVVDAVTKSPIVDKVVTFSMRSPVGAGETVAVTTGTDGIARLPSWRLGSGLGLYTATAVTYGWGPVTFSVMVPGKVVAIYDLNTINGFPVPHHAGWSEVHYVLYESGVMNVFRNTPDKPFTYAEQFMGTFSRAPGTIEFTMECAPGLQHCRQERRSMVVRGAELVYDESDPFFGPWIEVYALRGAQ